jgi:hypothetical protein
LRADTLVVFDRVSNTHRVQEDLAASPLGDLEVLTARKRRSTTASSINPLPRARPTVGLACAGLRLSERRCSPNRRFDPDRRRRAARRRGSELAGDRWHASTGISTSISVNGTNIRRATRPKRLVRRPSSLVRSARRTKWQPRKMASRSLAPAPANDVSSRPALVSGARACQEVTRLPDAGCAGAWSCKTWMEPCSCLARKRYMARALPGRPLDHARDRIGPGQLLSRRQAGDRRVAPTACSMTEATGRVTFRAE